MKMAERSRELDALVETIEFTLLSVIQGVALYFYINDAKGLLLGFNFEYWLYAAVAFVLITAFWSQSIVHVMSFISWPLEFVHNFLYFLVVVVEVLLFENMADPLHWFFWTLVFFVVVGILYFVDLRLLRTKKRHFEDSPDQVVFYETLVAQQKRGLYFLTPSGIAFSVVAWALIAQYPAIFITAHWHLALVGVQLVIALVTMRQFLKTYQTQFARIEIMDA